MLEAVLYRLAPVAVLYQLVAVAVPYPPGQQVDPFQLELVAVPCPRVAVLFLAELEVASHLEHLEVQLLVEVAVEVLLLLPAVEQYQLLEAEQVLRLEVDRVAEVAVLPVAEDLVDEHLAVVGLVDVLLAVEALVVLPLAVEGLAAEDLVVEVLEDAVLVVVEAFLPPVVEEAVLLAAVGEEVLQPVAVVDPAEVAAGVSQPAVEEVQHLVVAAARLPLLAQAGLVEVLVVG